ncbi:MAG: LysE family translocator [Gammaproteobacteria bacterium]|nr:LysE family translocator [Gammaproteobacteria bacterium]
MDIVISIILILGALLAGAVSPGPSFVLVARISMVSSRINGIFAAIGMGVGGALFSILALVGLQAALTNVPILYLVLKVFGGMYLIWLAYRIWNSTNQITSISVNKSPFAKQCLKSFALALVTQMSNPKAAVIYSGIFAALLPAEIPTVMYYLLPPLVFLVETGWYLLVTLILTSEKPRAAYLKSQRIYDRITATVLTGIGLRLVFDFESK